MSEAKIVRIGRNTQSNRRCKRINHSRRMFQFCDGCIRCTNSKTIDRHVRLRLALMVLAIWVTRD